MSPDLLKTICGAENFLFAPENFLVSQENKEKRDTSQSGRCSNLCEDTDL
jgi:hypothetical protein